MSIFVLTLNTWQERGPWRERWELIFACLKFYLPDVIAFQEVFNMEWADEIQKRTGFPNLIKSGQNSGLIILSKYPVVQSDCLVMKSKSSTEDYGRYAQFALLQIEKKQLAVFNTHLSWKLNEDIIRSQQINELMGFVNLKAGRTWERLLQPCPSVIMGDFNSDPNKPSIQTVGHVWEDTFALLNPGVPGLTWDYRNPFAERVREQMPERRIDYIFTQWLKGHAENSKVVFDQPDSNGTYPSDHFGVMTEIDF